MLGLTFTIKVQETEVEKLGEILKQFDVMLDAIKTYSDYYYHECKVSSYKTYKLLLEELDDDETINALLVG